MAAKYSDTFAGSGALGNIEVGGVAWQAIAGTWSRSGGYAAASENPNTTPPPIAVIDVGVGQVDLSANVSSNGGDALYCRVVDANNWIRARVRKWTTSSTYYVTQYEWGQYYYDNRITSGYGSPSDPYTMTAWSDSNSTAPNFSATYPNILLNNPFLTGNTRQDARSSSQTNYSVVLEKCVGGTVIQLGTYSASGTTSLRLRADGTSIQGYVNGSSRLSATVADFQNATKHGIGKGASESYSSAIDNFSLDPLIPPTPTIVAPSDNSTVVTGIPTLIVNAANWGGTNTKVEYQIASDSAFTTDLQTITEPDTALRASGNYSLTLTEAQALSQRAWYIRAHQLSASGLAGNWTATYKFTVAHAPNAINMSPTGGTGIVLAATNNLIWKFADTSSIDGQSAYQIVVERNDNGALVVDTGKVASTSQSYALTIDPALKDVQLRWKITLWDKEDVKGPTSNYALFVPTDTPVLTVIEPANGGTVDTSRPHVAWTFAASGGRTQASYRVTVKLNGAGDLLFDSQTITGATNDYTIASPVVENAKTYDFTVYATDTLGITVATTSTVTSTYEEPEVVPFQVDTSTYEDNGYVRLTWQAVADTAFVAWRVYRRKVGDQAWTRLAEIPEMTVTEYHDWLVPAMETYDYYVVQVVLRYDTPVESVVGSPVRVQLGVGGYWFIDQVSSDNNVHVFSVSDETYTDMNEQAEYTVVGRGRHVDEGESIGVSGSMTAKLRDDRFGTARQKKQDIEALRKRKIPVYFRNPFGDIKLIALGDIGVTRIAGVGQAEFVDLSIPYLEVF